MNEKTIPGVDVQLWFLDRSGKNIGPSQIQMKVFEDGYVGQLGEGKFAIQAVVEKGTFVLGVFVDTGDKEKKVILKRDVPSQERPFTQTNGGHLFEQKVVVHQSRAGVACTWPNDNHFNLVEVEKGGKIRYWEIALVSRDGEFFLTTQRLYEAQCYWNDESGESYGFNCPFFQKKRFPSEDRDWEKMVEFLEEIIGGASTLPLVRGYKPTPKLSAEGLRPNTGRVSWWSHSSGTGAIKTLKDGVEVEVKVHWKQVHREGSRLAYLVPGEIMNFNSLIEANREGCKETSFEYEAIGVLLVPDV